MDADLDPKKNTAFHRLYKLSMSKSQDISHQTPPKNNSFRVKRENDLIKFHYKKQANLQRLRAEQNLLNTPNSYYKGMVNKNPRTIVKNLQTRSPPHVCVNLLSFTKSHPAMVTEVMQKPEKNINDCSQLKVNPATKANLLRTKNLGQIILDGQIQLKTKNKSHQN